VAVLSRSGGHAVIAADACELNDFDLAELPTEFLSEAQTQLRANVINLTNPMDLGDLFDLDVYGQLAENTLGMDGVDGMVFMHTYMVGPEGDRSHELFERLHELSLRTDKPVAVHADTVASEVSRLKQVLPGPIFAEPADAVRALALLRDYHAHHVAEPVRPEGPAEPGRAKEVIDRARAEHRDPLIQEAMEIVSGYGASVVPSRLVSDEDAAVAAALELGFPAVLKVVSADISHKSDFGGVQLNLRGEEGVRAAWREMMEAVADRAPAARIDGALVQPMLRGGRDLIVGSRLDRNFGHVVLVGMGGVFVEILHDTAMRVAPFGIDTAQGMVRQLRAFPILAGVRGEPPADVDALVDTILAVCRLVSDVPEITELDLNPVRVLDAGKGCRVLDARMAVAAEGGSPDER
jgi:acetyltransferase